MFAQDRHQLRQVYFDVWSKMQRHASLTPLEQQVAHIINQHPEYHGLLADPNGIDADYPLDAGQTNPFLHMSLHLSIHEQVGTNRPCGIRDLYQQFVSVYHDPHQGEHQMMTPLAESIWQSQQQSAESAEKHYLHALQRALKNNK